MSKKVRFILILCFFSLILGFFGAVLYFGYSIKINKSDSTKVFDRNGVLITDVRSPDRKSSFSEISQIPKFAVDAILMREDKRFYTHYGVDFVALLRSTYNNLFEPGTLQGASTIDQQLVKLINEDFKRSLSSKIYQILGSVGVNLFHSKDEILVAYFNNLTFGNGVKGLMSACILFFDKDCSNLDFLEVAYLISKSKYPSNKYLANYTSQRLAKQGFGTGYDKQLLQIQDNFGVRNFNKAPHIVDMALQDSSLIENFSGSNIYLSVDLGIYDKIQKSIELMKPFLASKDANDGCVILIQKNKLVSMNVFQKYGANGSFINGCLRKRQVGSAMKPFIYALGFKNFGLDGDSKILDAPVEYLLDNGGKYQPKNFDLTYHGEVKISQALGSSLNIPAVKMLNQVGLNIFYDFMRNIAKSVGAEPIRDGDPNNYGLALALGVKEISPYDFTLLRSRFTRHDLLSKQGFSESVGEIGAILSSNEARLISFPQNNWFDVPGWAVKSGTSRNFVDGRVCGFNDETVLCIRVGNYNAKPMRDSGYQTAGVLWNAIANIIK